MYTFAKVSLIIILKNTRTGFQCFYFKTLSLLESKDLISHHKHAFLALKSDPLNFLVCHFL